MKSRAGLLALLCLVLANIGCVAQSHAVNTVPWWKGLPLTLAFAAAAFWSARGATRGAAELWRGRSV